MAIRTLVSAAQRGDLNTLRSLRAEGADLRAHADLLANTAIASGQVDVVRFLHENGFLASACSLESIRSALKSHHWSTLNYVFQQGCQIPAEILKDDVLYAPRSGPDEDIVAQAKDHLRGSVKAELIANLPDAGRRWKTYALWSRSVIPHLHSATEVIRFAQNAHGHGGFESRQEGDELLSYVAKLESHLASRFPTYANEFASFTESDGSDNSTSLVFNGRRVSGPMYANMTFFLEFLTHMPVFPNSVCEIGGGYGGPCRLWLSNNIHRPSRYVIVDLPESLRPFNSEVQRADFWR